MAYRHRHKDGTGLWSRRRQGYGMNLYRNKRDGWIGGVCAGLADHFNVEPWVVRLVVVSSFFFFNMLTFWAYLGACVLMAPRPKGRVEQEYQYDEDLHADRPRNLFRYRSVSPGERLKRARERLDDTLGRVEEMERYVTSRRYELDKEFSKIQD
ncbi:PspC domain-containing protein [Saccharospirillum mangrovi]|uniref:PspC domain-containing protein n=1 Tax=Saccharospirillum mangrovi TaxID=2161747 RepID=UPI000D33A647|nr:PspC domain-containing protein [Saccharospirillum mangrovi]